MIKYSYKSKSESNIDMKIYYCGSEACKPAHCWGPAIKDHYKIHFIHSGKGIFQIGNETYSLSKGQGFLISPNSISMYKADEEDPWSYSWIAFNGLNAEVYLNRANLTIDSPIFKYDKDDKINKCFEKMEQNYDIKENEDIKLLGLLYEFLALIIEANPVKNGKVSPLKKKDIYIKKTIEFIESNYSTKISVEEMAARIGLNRKYLSTLFKETLNISLQDFLIQYRLNKARELMINPNLSIGEIAISVGYNDMFQFSHAFKKLNGLSPSDFRNKNDY